jgi:hypothetical protein
MPWKEVTNMADEERKDEADELIGDLEAHGAEGELAPTEPSTNNCTHSCPCDEV